MEHQSPLWAYGYTSYAVGFVLLAQGPVDSPTAIWTFLQAAGITGALLMFVWLGMTKRLMWRWQHEEIVAIKDRQIAEALAERDLARRERDEWKGIAWKGQEIANTTVASLLAAGGQRA